MFSSAYLLQVTSYKPSTFLSDSYNTGWIKSQFLRSISVALPVSGVPHAFPMSILLFTL